MPTISEVSIYIKRGELILGPFSEPQTVARYHRGELRDTDLAMVDGMTGWHPLATYIVDETDEAPSSFDASAPPQIEADEPPRFEVRDLRSEERPPATGAEAQAPASAMADEPRDQLISQFGHRSVALVNPVGAAWALLGLGVLVMFLSRWPWTLWTPLVAGAVVLSVLQLMRRNFAHGGPLLAVSLLLPWFVWSQWLASKHAVVTSTTAGAVSVPATPVPVATPAMVTVPVVQDPPKVVDVPANPPPPEPVPVRTVPDVGDRVALVRDTMLLFNAKQFRVGKAGEEFEVLKISPDRIFLKSRDRSGGVIAVTAPPSEVRLLPAAPPEQAPAP